MGKVGGFEQARRDVRYTSDQPSPHPNRSSLHNGHVRFIQHRTKKVRCAHPLRRQIDFGAGGERRRLSSRGGVWSETSRICSIYSTSVDSPCEGGGSLLSVRKMRLSCMLPQRTGSMVCLRARVGGGRASRFFLLPPFFRRS